MALPGVAIFAGHDHVLLGGFTATRDRDQMIHRQGFLREFPSAMITNAAADLLLPPGSPSQLLSLPPLTFNMLLIAEFIEKHWAETLPRERFCDQFSIHLKPRGLLQSREKSI